MVFNPNGSKIGPRIRKNWELEAYKCKIDLNNLSGKNLLLRLLDKKGPEIGQRWSFSGIIIGSLQQHKGLKLT